MKIIAVQHKDIYITLEFSAEQLQRLSDYIEKTLPLFGKVFQGDESFTEEISGNNEVLKSLLKEIKSGP